LIKSKKESYRFCEEVLSVFFLGARTKFLSIWKKNMLSVTALREVKTSRDMYLDSLVELGYVERDKIESESYNSNASNLRIIKAALFAGLYPNLVTIKKPEQKFTETAHGNVAIDTEASDLKFYTDKERVFIHPSSVNSGIGKFEDPFLVYHNLIHTSKMYLRDTTCVSVWPALMFGGDLDVDFHHNVITMDTYFKFDAAPRISALTYGLRKLLDKELALKIEDPTRDVLNTPVGQVITKLFTADGL
jgi:ATP-dependent RNA helicase DHX57